MDHDFNVDILHAMEHRPWPMPDGPWIMTQTWHDLLFAHWSVEPERVSAKIPAPLELELFNDRAWVAVVPFRMTNVAPRGVPSLPWISEFAELNVRTYVRLQGKPGVFFFSLDAGNAVAVRVAKMMFGLPYFLADMALEKSEEGIRYRSRRSTTTVPPTEFVATYRPVSPVYQARPGSLEYFLTERYCLYTVNGRGRAFRVDIHHPPWPLQTAEAAITVNSMADAAGIALPSAAPLLHFSKRQDVVAWSLARVDGD